jgi:hypothetical protein
MKLNTACLFRRSPDTGERIKVRGLGARCVSSRTPKVFASWRFLSQLPWRKTLTLPLSCKGEATHKPRAIQLTQHMD